MAANFDVSPVFRAYIFYSMLLVAKMLFMSVFTGLQRFKNKAFANPEDTKMHKIKVRTDENVERVRRAHLNDLENIPLFFLVGAVYSLTNPSVAFATLLFRVFTIARYLHTFVYAVFVIPQPARALTFFAGEIVIIYMVVQSIIAFA